MSPESSCPGVTGCGHGLHRDRPDFGQIVIRGTGGAEGCDQCRFPGLAAPRHLFQVRSHLYTVIRLPGVRSGRFSSSNFSCPRMSIGVNCRRLAAAANLPPNRLGSWPSPGSSPRSRVCSTIGGSVTKSTNDHRCRSINDHPDRGRHHDRVIAPADRECDGPDVIATPVVDGRRLPECGSVRVRTRPGTSREADGWVTLEGQHQCAGHGCTRRVQPRLVTIMEWHAEQSGPDRRTHTFVGGLVHWRGARCHIAPWRHVVVTVSR